MIASPRTWQEWMLVVPHVNDKHLALGSKVFWKDENDEPYLTGTVTAFEPNSRFVLELEDVSWSRKAKPGEVTYALTLSETNGRTRVEFALGDLSIDPEAQQWYDAYAASRELEVIKQMAEK